MLCLTWTFRPPLDPPPVAPKYISGLLCLYYAMLLDILDIGRFAVTRAMIVYVTLFGRTSIPDCVLPRLPGGVGTALHS